MLKVTLLCVMACYTKVMTETFLDIIELNTIKPLIHSLCKGHCYLICSRNFQ